MVSCTKDHSGSMITGILLVSFFSQEGIIVRFSPISIGAKFSSVLIPVFIRKKGIFKENTGSRPDDLRNP